MKMPHCFDIYSDQILSFRLSGEVDYDIIPSAQNSQKTILRHLELAEKRKAETLIIFGAANGELANQIASQKPENMQLIICDLYPEHIRKLKKEKLNAFFAAENTHLLTDSSLWAILLLLLQYGFSSENCHLILNQNLDEKCKKRHQQLQKIFSGLRTTAEQHHNEKVKITVAAILSPDEPDLDTFISSLPDWIHEIVLVWDSQSADSHPQLRHKNKVNIINEHRPLNANFAEQRNLMLSKCSGDWIIYLDADERLDDNAWNTILETTSIDECNGWYLPRMTFYPDESHCKVGYGLWPDLQMRFFRNSKDLKFVNTIHEQLHGIKGPPGILTKVVIKHLTHLLKSRKNIESKLKSFNKATEGKFSHKLGDEFPNIANKLLTPSSGNQFRSVILPELNL